MKLSVDGKNYVVHFERELTGHRNYSCSFHEGSCQMKKIELLPDIFRVACQVESMKGESACSLKDRFFKPTGRKIAFTHAIQTLPKELRTKLWDEYLKQDPDAKRTGWK